MPHMPRSSWKGGDIDLKRYRKIRTLNFSGETPLILTAGSFILFFVSAAVVLLASILVTGTGSFSFTVRGPSDLLPLLATILLILLTGALHEGFHALAYLLLHRRPLFGWGRESALLYCSCSSEGVYTRNESLFVLIAPFVLITTLGIGVMVLAPAWGIAALVLVPLNAAGSTADLWAAGLILRTPPDSLVLEEGGTLTIFVRE